MFLRRSQPLILALVAAGLVLSGCGGGEAVRKATTGTIVGAVSDAQTSAAIAGATVTLPPTSAATSTSASGGFTLHHIRPGTYTVVAGADGYTYGSATVTVTAGSVASATLALYPASAPTTVGSGGGTVQDTGPSGEQAKCIIPAGALTQDTEVAVTALPASQAPPSPNGDPNHAAAAFTPDGQTFAAPVTITVPTPGPMTPGSSVSLFQWDPDQAAWTASGTATVDSGGLTASASVSHFCVYGVIAQRSVSSWPSVGIAGTQIHEVVVQSFVMTQPATVDDMYGIALASSVEVVSGAIYWLRYSERPRYPSDPERSRIDQILTLLEQAVAHNQGGGGGG